MSSKLAVAAALALTVVACDGDSTRPTVPAAVPAGITITAPALALHLCGTPLQLGAIVVDQAGLPVTDARVTWSAEQWTVITVDSTGKVYPWALGTATIRASLGSVSAHVEVEVLPVPRTDEEIVGTWAWSQRADSVTWPDSVITTFSVSGKYCEQSHSRYTNYTNGVYHTSAGAPGSIRSIETRYLAPKYAVTSKGIFQVTGDTLKLEIVQTEPSIPFRPPTVEGGFGSTWRYSPYPGAPTTDHVKVYTRR